MKKVFILAVVAVFAISVMSFAALSLTGGGVVQLNYASSPTSVNLSQTNWWLRVTSSGTGYSYSANISDGSIYSFYFTLPVVENLSLITGYQSNYGEQVFGGTAFSGPNNGQGWLGFGYNKNSYVGAQYTSDMFNLYAQTTVSTSPSVDVYGDTTMGPVALYLGAEGNFATAYVGANVTVASANLFGQVAYDTTNATLNSYTVGANVAFGNNSVTAELDNTNALNAWFNTTVSGIGVQLGAAFDNFSSFNNVTANLTWTPVGSVSAETDFTYSAADGFSAELTLYTGF